MTTFERRFIDDEVAQAEPKNAYYTYYQDPAVCDMLLKEFGLEGNYMAGANIAGFLKVAEAMKAQGCV